MNEKLNIDDITKGALAVICSQVLPKDEEGLTVSQAAQMLGMSVAKLSQMRQSNTGPRFYRENGKILYTPSSIREFIRSEMSENFKNRRKK